MSAGDAAARADDGSGDPSVVGQRLRYLVAGQPVQVSDLSDQLGGYTANIVAADQHLVWIDVPFRRDGMLTLSVGQLVSVRLHRSDDAVYLFDTVVAELRADDRKPYGLARPVSIDRRPHRRDVRVSLVLDATFRPGGAGQARSGKVVDLSAGGVGLITASDLVVGDELVLVTDVPSFESPLRVESRVVIRSRNFYGRTPGGAIQYQYGLQFLDVDDEVRERIVASVVWNLTR